MLNLKPYLKEIEDIEPGQTLRINHTDCEAGEDARRRLYLTRTHADECRVIAYCHNCQQGGYHSDGHYKSYRNTKHGIQPSNDKVSISDSIDEPVGLIERFAHWPTDAQAWALQRGLSQVDLNWYGIKYDPSTDRVYIPRHGSMDRRKDNHGDLVGYQLRSLHGYARPKYMTAQRKDASNWTFIHPKDDKCDWAVIVEDMVSAIHILRATETVWTDANRPGVFVNYGTRIDPTMMWTIAQNFQWCTVWLDNDNQHVDNQAAMMARTIAMYNDRIKVGREREASDPKHYQEEEICRILDEVNYG